MLIKRAITSQFKDSLKNNKTVVILYGPRQAGKTTLIKELLPEIQKEAIFFNGDDLYAQKLLQINELESLKRVVGEHKIVVIDEAQRIDNIGLSLKLLVDNLPITIIASGSSSFDLANKISEPLTGRTRTFWLYPFSYQEISEKYKQVSLEISLSEMLRFGMYPKVHTLNTNQDKENYLYDYLNNYLYKDILNFGGVKKPKKIVDLLALLALQVGKEVSIAELAQNLAMSQKTVQNYLDVLEKMFVIFNLRGFSRNLRKEIYKTSKYYFSDIGLRNALIRNFNQMDIRQDSGELFENWFIAEKIKLANNSQKPANFYFWRTYDQQEIDLIEEREGKLVGYECKWSAKKEASAPKDWLESYQNASFVLVNPSSCFGLLG